MIKLLALNRGAEKADRSFLPVNPPAVLLNTLLSLKTEIFVCGCTFFFPHCCSSEAALLQSLDTSEVQSPNPPVSHHRDTGTFDAGA